VKKALIGLSIIAILTLCVPNVAAVQASKTSATPHERYTIFLPQQETTLMFRVSTTTATTNTIFFADGRLTEHGTGFPIPFSPISIEQRRSDDDRWVAINPLVSTYQTDLFGNYHAMCLTPIASGEYHLRAVYGGSGTLNPSVSDEIVMTII
jgi:hypothetical protein